MADGESDGKDKDFEELMETLRAVACMGCGKTGEGVRCAGCAKTEDAKEASEAAAARVRSIEATIPALYRWSAFDAPDLRKRVRNGGAIAVARTRVKAPWIVLRGPSTAGKTTLAVAMLREWARTTTKGDGVFVPAHRLGVARIQHRAGDGEPELVERSMRAALVVLDDVGNERAMATNALPDVIFERHAEQRATWITTGLTDEQLEQRYGEGIARRIVERAVIIDCAGAK